MRKNILYRLYGRIAAGLILTALFLTGWQSDGAGCGRGANRGADRWVCP